jgi:hypothetical protein
MSPDRRECAARPLAARIRDRFLLYSRTARGSPRGRRAGARAKEDAMEMLQLPMSVGRLVAYALGLVVLLFVVGSFSWPLAILVVGFSVLAVPFMIAVMRAGH